MLAKMTSKNQLTLPKKVVHQLGFEDDEERYFDVEVRGNTVLMRPVTVTIEEKVSPSELEKFKAWTLDHSEDIAFSTAEDATNFLRKRMKKK